MLTESNCCLPGCHSQSAAIWFGVCMAQCGEYSLFEWFPLLVPACNLACAAGILLTSLEQNNCFGASGQRPLDRQLLKHEMLLYGLLARSRETDLLLAT